MRHLFFLPFWASLLLIGCAAPTAQPLLKKSPHDAAVHRTANRLEGKKKKAKHVRRLEAAFRLAQQADLLAADSLLGLSTPDRWLYIHALYRRIQSRQAEIGPLLPLRADDGYTPDLLLVGDIAGRESASRKQAAAYLYGHANDLLATSAQTGRKQPAQQAYYTLRNLKDNYYRYWENTNTLIDSAYRAGQVYVLVQSDGHDVWGQGSLWQPIRTQAFAGYDTEWTHFYHDPASREQYDYRVLAHLASMMVGPEMRSES
ncbi:MAG TPA: hypothetical protein PK858_11725, partial [Saprospiraceae bacterium]|nr:hypothetical protein [Saprospiraceae bacterium]